MQDSDIMVSVCIITYNQKAFIREAIEGVLMQKTSFPIELIIGEDCSTDNTRKIVVEFAEKYPKIIRPLLPSKNLGMMQNFISTLQEANGKYIAICEGDDYWIDSLKLQKQVDFLEKNIEYSLVFSNRFVLTNNNFKYSVFFKSHYSELDVLSGTNWGLQTTCLRKSSLDLNKLDALSKFINGDRLLPYLCSLSGKIKRIKDFTAVYRVTGMGVATSRPKEKIIEISLDDFWLFHETLLFPNKFALLYGQSKYLSSLIKEHKFNPFRIIKNEYRLLSKHEKPTLVKLLLINLLIVYYFILKISMKIYLYIFFKFSHNKDIK